MSETPMTFLHMPIDSLIPPNLNFLANKSMEIGQVTFPSQRHCLALFCSTLGKTYRENISERQIRYSILDFFKYIYILKHNNYNHFENKKKLYILGIL